MVAALPNSTDSTPQPNHQSGRDSIAAVTHSTLPPRKITNGSRPVNRHNYSGIMHSLLTLCLAHDDDPPSDARNISLPRQRTAAHTAFDNSATTSLSTWRCTTPRTRHDSLGSVPVASYRLVLPPSHCSRTSYRLRGPSVHSPEGLVFPSRAHPPTDAEPPTHIHLLPALNSEGRCDYQAPVRISKESINNAAAPSPTRCDSKAPPRISTESVNDAATPTSPYSRPRLRMDVDPTP
jgi:hypothetical protein